MILFMNSFCILREDKFLTVAEKISYMLYLHKYGNHKDVLARITEPIYELETLFDNCKMLYQNEKIILFRYFSNL